MKTKITKILIGTILAIAASFMVISCEKSEDDKTAENLLLLSFLSGGGGTAQGETASSVRVAIAGVSASIRTASSQASLMNFKKKIPTKDEFMAKMQNQIIREKILKDISPKSFPTAIQTESGSCTGGTCNATLNGDVNCQQGGTATLDKLVVSLTAQGTAGYKGTSKGNIKLTNCSSYGADYFNFPNYVGSVATGNISVDSSSDYQFSIGAGTTQTEQKYDIKLLETSNIESTNLKIGNGAETVLSGVKSSIDLQINTTLTNFSTTTGTNSFTFQADYSDILVGTAALTGSIGGVNTNLTKTYAGQTFKYRVNCEFKIEASGNPSSKCDVTNL
ncbi:hypothetical protein [Leptospira sp. GIMC2001]|uniref:hypothetical protein n=1 Tax=Leptospira sp. GIMC2001 TaxID=1513297 RepID=UPI00234B4929|nr:hypothetical protein [Leptospira sp. GIMC2001]WCL49754.1 hypothetical protein O4O04_02730 [Leptospira sp. GIMC2001]